MSTVSWHLLLYVISFVVIWLGSGLVVSSVSSLAKSWRMSPFTLSFFFLGLLTSLPEIAIGFTAVANNDPIIFVGNLLGGVIVLFLLIIPLLGIFGKGVKIPHQLPQKELFLVLFTIIAPTLMISDRRLAPWEGAILIVLYVVLLLTSLRTNTARMLQNSKLPEKRKKRQILILKVIVGMVLLFLASQQIVSSTMFFAALTNVSPFVMSLIVVSIGTNIPELSIIFRAIVNREKDIALADYLGSAVANTPLLGILTIVHGQTIFLPNHFLHRFIFISISLILFFFFARSRKTLSRQESFILLGGYVAFLIVELLLLGA
jgi:cation:H+ antiporter